MNHFIIPFCADVANHWTAWQARSRSLAIDHIKWDWRNQRQIRKNRRRAHAAGARNAFKP